MIMKNLLQNRQNRWAVLAIFCFACITGLETFVNHLNFRTFALDLGAYTNALWDYAHFQWNDSRVFLSEQINLLHDHFDLYLILFSPFSYLFGSYTLLIFQWLSLLFGAWGFYKWLCESDERRPFAISGLLFYLTFFGIYAALSFDYHSNVVAVAFFPWFWSAMERGKRGQTFFWLVLIVIGKENLSLWMAAVGVSTFFLLHQRRLSLYVTLCSVVYFLCITQWVMPALDVEHGRPIRFAYSALGADMKQAVKHLFSHPFQSIELLFRSQFEARGFENAKLEFWVFMLGSGLWMVVRKPAFLIAFAPLILQKMFHDQPTLWGVEAHYNMEFLPLLGILIFSSIPSFTWKQNHYLAYFIVVCNVAVTIRMMDHTEIWMDKSRLRIYQSNHYPDWNIYEERMKVLEMIPANAAVSAQTTVLPHVAWRDQCYTFPEVPEGIDYILLAPDDKNDKEQDESFRIEMDHLVLSGKWKIAHQSEHIVLLEKN